MIAQKCAALQKSYSHQLQYWGSVHVFLEEDFLLVLFMSLHTINHTVAALFDLENREATFSF